MYYRDKLGTLQDLFGTAEVRLEDHALHVQSQVFPILDDVIILSSPEHYSPAVRRRLATSAFLTDSTAFAEDIQFTFGEEWKRYGTILPEHKREFRQYFDLVSLESLREARICDLGCGSGRWSFFMKEFCKEIVLVDFSDAVFVARKN